MLSAASVADLKNNDDTDSEWCFLGCYSAMTFNWFGHQPAVSKQPSWCTSADMTKKGGEKIKIKKSVKLKTLTASIHPNNKDILQILLAITYFTSCIKKKKHKYKIDFPSLVFLKCIGKQVNVHSGLVVSIFLFFSGWHLSSSDKVAVFFSSLTR